MAAGVIAGGAVLFGIQAGCCAAAPADQAALAGSSSDLGGGATAVLLPSPGGKPLKSSKTGEDQVI